MERGFCHGLGKKLHAAARAAAIEIPIQTTAHENNAKRWPPKSCPANQFIAVHPRQIGVRQQHIEVRLSKLYVMQPLLGVMGGNNVMT